jgi:hypothetical protein
MPGDPDEYPTAHNDIDMSESRLLAHWLHAAEQRGIWYMHIFSGQFYHYGMPDLLLIGNGQVWFVELKTITGTLSESQEHVRRLLRQANANYLLHTPHDWVSGASLRLLDYLAEDGDEARMVG